ncbi:MAG: D-aminoacyl-tRNA deacylase [Chitinophagales bacterium]
MRAVIQRVKHASVTIDGKTHSQTGRGLLVLVGIEDADDEDDIIWLSNKIVNLRILNIDNDMMPDPANEIIHPGRDLSVKQTCGNILVVSQFTLHASTKKGNRPSYSKAAKPAVAITLYEKFLLQLEKDSGRIIQSGVFGAMMEVALINNGPVTIIIDSKNKE